MKEAIYRHYYKKLKRLLRGRGVPAYDDFLPGDLLFRGQSKAQTDGLLKGGATKSNGSGVLGDDKDKTFATTRMKLARIYAGRGDAMVATGNSQKPYRREPGEIISFIKQKDPGYSNRTSVPDSWSSVPLSKWRSGAINDDTVALRSPITKDELRGILVRRGKAKHGYKPLPLREAKERGLSAKLRLRELALGAGTRIRHIPLKERRLITSREDEIIIPRGERGGRDKFVDSLAKINNKNLSAKLRLRELAYGRAL